MKYHFKTEQGIQNLTREEATRMAGEDPDHATRDLFEAIERGEFPAWRVEVQIMPPEEAKTYRFDPFDITKVWPHERLSRSSRSAGWCSTATRRTTSPRSSRRRSPRATSCPASAPRPTRCSRRGSFSYHDAHLHRLGPNYHLLPGQRAEGGARWQTTSATGTCASTRTAAAGRTTGPTPSAARRPTRHGRSRPSTSRDRRRATPTISGDDDFVQPGELYRQVMTDTDREHLVGNIVAHLGGAQKRIQLRQTALFYKADADYGKRVAKGLGLKVEEVKRLAAMSQEERVKATAL